MIIVAVCFQRRESTAASKRPVRGGVKGLGPRRVPLLLVAIGSAKARSVLKIVLFFKWANLGLLFIYFRFSVLVQQLRILVPSGIRTRIVGAEDYSGDH